MNTDRVMLLGAGMVHSRRSQAHSSEGHRHHGRSSTPRRRLFGAPRCWRRAGADLLAAPHTDNSSKVVRSLDGSHRLRTAYIPHCQWARKEVSIYDLCQWRADCSRSVHPGIDGRWRQGRQAGSPKWVVARAGWRRVRARRSAWPGYAAGAEVGWSPPRRARRWKRRAVRLLVRPGANLRGATRAPPRRARRRPRSSWSTRPARWSGRMRALATRQPHRRARRGPRHGCQGTGWRPGKPRGSRNVTGRFTRAAGTSHRVHTRPTHGSGTWKLKRDSRFS